MRGPDFYRIRFVLTRLLLGAAAFFLVCLALVGLFFDSLFHLAVERASGYVNGELRVGPARVVWGGLAVEDIALLGPDGETVFEVPEARVALRPLGPLLGGGAISLVGDIALSRPGLRVQVDRTGTVNLTRLFLPTGTERPSLLADYRGRLTITDGWMLYRDERSTGFLYELNRWTGHADFSAPGYADLDFAVRPSQSGEGSLRLAGRVAVKEPAVGLTLAVHNLELLPFGAHPGLAPGMAIQDGALDANLRIQAEADSWGQVAAGAFPFGTVELRGLDLRLPTVPWAMRELSGTFSLVGAQARTDRLKGKLEDVPFELWGKVLLMPTQWMSVALKTPALPAAFLARAFEHPPDIEGDLALDATVEGPLLNPDFRGLVTSPSLRIDGQTVEQFVLRFEAVNDLLQVEELSALAAGGELRGDGLIFLGAEEPTVVLHLEGQGASLADFAPTVAQSADFDVSVLGSVQDPVVYGQGRLQGLGAWGQGADTAGGRFLLGEDAIYLVDGSATRAGATLRIPLAVYDTVTQELTASVSGQDFPLAAGGATGSFTGDLAVWGSLKDLSTLTARGRLADSRLSLGDLEATEVTGDFLFERGELLSPGLSLALEGTGRLDLAGGYDLEAGSGDLALQATGLNLALLGLPGAGDLQARLQGHLAGLAGFEAALSSPGGKLASVGYRQASGDLGLVAWLEGLDPALAGLHRLDGRIAGMLAATGRPEKMDFLYNTRLSGGTSLGLGFVDALGEGVLAGTRLRLNHNLLAWDNAVPESLSRLPTRRYVGRAYTFFGPSMGPPLEVLSQPSLPYPESTQIAFDGTADLAARRLDLRYRASGFDLGWLAERPWLSGDRSLNQLLGFRVASGVAFSEGTVQGSLSSPRVESSLSVPWLLMGATQSPGGSSYSLAADLSLDRWTLTFEPLVLSGRAFDPRLPGALGGALPADPELGLMSVRGSIRLGQPLPELDLRVATGGWKAREAAFFVPQPARRLVPYGLVSTQDLHLWGPVERPSLSGHLALEQGGLWLGSQPLPLERLGVNFTSQQGEVRVEHFDLASGPVTLTGQGLRRRDGSLAGTLWGRQIPLAYFEPFGSPWNGLQGDLDLALELETRPGSPSLRLGLEGSGLTWNPAVIGGQGPPVTIEELVLGRVTRSEHGLSASDSSVGLRLQGGRLLADVAPGAVALRLEDGAELRAEGAVDFTPPSGSLTDWFVGPEGPDFGKGTVPFRVEARNLTARSLSRLLGRAPGNGAVELSGVLNLEGQWYRDHLLAAGSELPRYRLELDEMVIEASNDGVVSGLYLEEPTTASYQRAGTTGTLALDPSNLVFFHRDDQTQDRVKGGALAASGNFGLMEAPDGEATSNLSVTATALPLRNLGFLLPEGMTVSGLLQRLDLRLAGPLLTPELGLAAVLQDGQIGPVVLAEMVAGLTGRKDAQGNYQLAFVGPLGEAFRAYLGSTRDPERVLDVEGAIDLVWDTTLDHPQDRLHPVWEGRRLSRQSPLNLTAHLVDRDLQMLSAMLPGQEKTSGWMRGRLALDGTLAEPELAGTFSIQDATLESDLLAAPLTDLNVATTFEKIPPSQAEPSPFGLPGEDELLSRYSIERFEGRLGGQPFTLSGKAELAGVEPTFIDVSLQGERLPLRVGDLFEGEATVDLQLAGRPGYLQGASRPTLVPLVEGSIVVPDGDINLPLALLGGSGKKPSPLRTFPFRYDVNLDLGNDVWVHLLDSSVRTMGQLRVLPGSGGTPVLAGELLLTRGTLRVPLYDANFRLRQGWAYFENSLIPELESVEATAELGGYQIIAQVDGTYPDSLHVEMLSDPPLPQAELSRILVLGGLPSALTSGTGSDTLVGGIPGFLASQGVSFLSGFLTSQLTQELGRALFLSEVSFEFIPPIQYSVKVAKALDERDRFLLTLTRIIQADGSNENLYGIEWRFQPGLLVRTAVDQLAQPRFWFQAISRF